jgi:hypothetical protein
MVVGSLTYFASSEGRENGRLRLWQMAPSLHCGAGPVVLAGFHNAGILKSVDGGLTWQSSSEGPAARGFARLYPFRQVVRHRPQEHCGIGQ